jgi:hypothetical protein
MSHDLEWPGDTPSEYERTFLRPIAKAITEAGRYRRDQEADINAQNGLLAYRRRDVEYEQDVLTIEAQRAEDLAGKLGWVFAALSELGVDASRLFTELGEIARYRRPLEMPRDEAEPTDHGLLARLRRSGQTAHEFAIAESQRTRAERGAIFSVAAIYKRVGQMRHREAQGR